jgi:hypothetical protein
MHIPPLWTSINLLILAFPNPWISSQAIHHCSYTGVDSYFWPPPGPEKVDNHGWFWKFCPVGEVLTSIFQRHSLRFKTVATVSQSRPVHPAESCIN